MRCTSVFDSVQRIHSLVLISTAIQTPGCLNVPIPDLSVLNVLLYFDLLRVILEGPTRTLPHVLDGTLQEQSYRHVPRCLEQLLTNIYSCFLSFSVVFAYLESLAAWQLKGNHLPCRTLIDVYEMEYQIKYGRTDTCADLCTQNIGSLDMGPCARDAGVANGEGWRMNQVRIVAHKQYSVTSHDCLEGVRPAGSGFRVGFREENEEASRSAPFASRQVVEVEEEMTWPKSPTRMCLSLSPRNAAAAASLVSWPACPLPTPHPPPP